MTPELLIAAAEWMSKLSYPKIGVVDAMVLASIVFGTTSLVSIALAVISMVHALTIG